MLHPGFDFASAAYLAGVVMLLGVMLFSIVVLNRG